MFLIYPEESKCLMVLEEQKQAIRQADCLNGMIVTDSESDNLDDYLPWNASDQSTQKLVTRKHNPFIAELVI